MPPEKKEYKYTYWHKIIAVSNEYAKDNPQIKPGMFVGRQNKHPYGVCIVDFKKRKEYPSAYTLEYIIRLPAKLSSKEVRDELVKIGAVS